MNEDENKKTPETEEIKPKKKHLIDWNLNYTTIAIYALIVILFAVFCAFIFLNNNDFGKYLSAFISVFNPILYGILFAYLMNYIVRFFENTLLKSLVAKGHRRTSRLYAVIMTTVIVIAVISVVVLAIVPNAKQGYADLKGKMGIYIEDVRKWFEQLADGEGLFASYMSSVLTYLNDLVQDLYAMISNASKVVLDSLGEIVVTLKDILLGLVFAFYFLFSKERLTAQLKKALRAVTSDGVYEKTLHVVSLIDEKFGGFLTIRILDSIVVGVVCFLGTWPLDIPYHALISLVLGAACLVPIFGPIVAITVTGFIVFARSTNPWLLIAFLAFAIIIHIVNSNLLRFTTRKASAGLSAMLIFVAILVMTGFFGLFGLVFGVPIFAVIYDLIKEWSENRLKKKAAPVETIEYISTGAGEELNKEAEEKEEKKAKRDEKIKNLFKKKKKSTAAQEDSADDAEKS